MSLSTAAGQVFRDFVTAGVPSSGLHKPVKGEIVDLFRRIESSMGVASRAAALISDLSDVPLGWSVTTEGYAAAGDGGGGVYVKVASNPSHNGKFTSGDGAFFELRTFEPRIEQFGGGINVTDNRTAYADGIGYCAALSLGELRFGSGTYSFTGKPAVISQTVQLVGASKSLTNLRRAYSAGSNDEGFIELLHPLTGGKLQGSGVRGMQLIPGNGTTGGTMLKASTAGPITGFVTFEDLAISPAGGTGTFHRCMLIDGSLNTTAGGQGFRDVVMRETFLFQSAAAETLRVLNGVNCALDLWTNGNVTIFGGATATSMSTTIEIEGEILGQLFVGNATRVLSYCSADSVTHSTNTSKCEHWGGVGDGGYSNFGAASNLCGSRIGFEASKGATSGYSRLPNGVLMQWMTVSLGTSYANFTFPAAFSSGCTPNVTATPLGSAATVFCGGHSTTAASLAASAAVTATVHAFGW
jgi:hypothetical protein